MDGKLEQRDGRWQLRFDRKLPHPPQKVWRAISEPEHLTAWFPFDIEGERAAGATVLFVFRNGEAPPFEGEMTAYQPPRVMELRWGGNETVRLEIRPDGGGSVLTLLNTFDDLGKAARDAAGWHVCLDALDYRLNSADAPWTPRERWQHVHQTYVERLGPEASRIGPPAPAAEST